MEKKNQHQNDHSCSSNEKPVINEEKKSELNTPNNGTDIDNENKKISEDSVILPLKSTKSEFTRVRHCLTEIDSLSDVIDENSDVILNKDPVVILENKGNTDSFSLEQINDNKLLLLGLKKINLVAKNDEKEQNLAESTIVTVKRKLDTEKNTHDLLNPCDFGYVKENKRCKSNERYHIISSNENLNSKNNIIEINHDEKNKHSDSTNYKVLDSKGNLEIKSEILENENSADQNMLKSDDGIIIPEPDSVLSNKQEIIEDTETASTCYHCDVYLTNENTCDYINIKDFGNLCKQCSEKQILFLNSRKRTSNAIKRKKKYSKGKRMRKSISEYEEDNFFLQDSPGLIGFSENYTDNNKSSMYDCNKNDPSLIIKENRKNFNGQNELPIMDSKYENFLINNHYIERGIEYEKYIKDSILRHQLANRIEKKAHFQPYYASNYNPREIYSQDEVQNSEYMDLRNNINEILSKNVTNREHENLNTVELKKRKYEYEQTMKVSGSLPPCQIKLNMMQIKNNKNGSSNVSFMNTSRNFVNHPLLSDKKEQKCFTNTNFAVKLNELQKFDAKHPSLNNFERQKNHSENFDPKLNTFNHSSGNAYINCPYRENRDNINYLKSENNRLSNLYEANQIPLNNFHLRNYELNASNQQMRIPNNMRLEQNESIHQAEQQKTHDIQGSNYMDLFNRRRAEYNMVEDIRENIKKGLKGTKKRKGLTSKAIQIIAKAKENERVQDSSNELNTNDPKPTN